MPLLVSDVTDHAASIYLNDAARIRWTREIMIPYVKGAYGELQSALENADLPPIHEISAVLTIAPGTLEVPAPADMTLPISLEERAPGESRFTKMDEQIWEPDADPGQKLNVWVFREGKMQLLGATTTREVKLKYLRSLSTLSGEASAIELPNAKEFLAARAAHLAAVFGGRATERGLAAKERADYFIHVILSTLTKRMQSKGVRRRRYKWRRR